MTDEQIDAVWASTDTSGYTLYEAHTWEVEMRRRFARALLASGASEGQAEWRDVPGFEGAYEASSAGEIRSKETGKLLPKNLMGKGYVKADLWRSGIRTQTSVHRVIAMTFHGLSEGREVNHIDGDKQNNAASNLEWVTRSENEVHSRYVLGNLCIPVLAEHIENGTTSYHASIAKAAEELGLRDELVRQCVAGKRKLHNGYRFISVSSLEQLTALHPSAEIAALRLKVESAEKLADHYHEKNITLRERIAGMEKDAERYRWLAPRFTGYDFDWMPSEPEADDGRDVTAAIDAAIAKEKQ